MTLKDIEVTDEQEDESRDLVAEAGRIVRGNTLMIGGAEHVRALVDELGGALRLALDTFRDHERVHNVCGRTPMAEAAKIPADHIEQLLERLEPKAGDPPSIADHATKP